MTLVPKKWEGSSETEQVAWTVEIEHDRFSCGEPFVVSLLVADHDEDGRSEALATPTPAQAREMAAALLVYAHFAERANAESPMTPCPEHGCWECGTSDMRGNVCAEHEVLRGPSRDSQQTKEDA